MSSGVPSLFNELMRRMKLLSADLLAQSSGTGLRPLSYSRVKRKRERKRKMMKSTATARTATRRAPRSRAERVVYARIGALDTQRRQSECCISITRATLHYPLIALLAVDLNWR